MLSHLIRIALSMMLLVACSGPSSPDAPDSATIVKQNSAQPARTFASEPEWSSRLDSGTGSVDSRQAVLLYASAPGCGGLFADDVAATLATRYYRPVRFDPFHRPDVARQYGLAGCPALAVLWPDGSLIARAVDIPARRVREFLVRHHDHLQKRPEMIRRISPAGRRRVAIHPAAVRHQLAAGFDSTYSGFGGPAKHIEASVLLLLQELRAGGDERAGHWLTRTLDRILASQVWDREQGGVFSYSHTPDWQSPSREKDLVDQAGLILVLGREARVSRNYQRAGQELIDYIRKELYQPDMGTFASRQILEASRPPWTDPVPCSDRNALTIPSLLVAGPALGRSVSAREMAFATGRWLLEHAVEPDGAVKHCPSDDSTVEGLLVDQMLVALAFTALAQYGAGADFRNAADDVKGWTERHLESESGSFIDGPSPDLNGWRELRTFEDDLLPGGNALAAEFYLMEHDREQAARILADARLESGLGRAHAWAARIALLLERGSGSQ